MVKTGLPLGSTKVIIYSLSIFSVLRQKRPTKKKMCYSNTIYSERKKEELAFCYKIGFEDVYILIFGSAFNNGSFNRLSSPFISMLYN